MENNIVCKAEIKTKTTKLFQIMIIVLFLISLLAVPVHCDSYDSWDGRNIDKNYRNILGVRILYKEIRNYGIRTSWNLDYGIYVGLIALGLFIIILLWKFAWGYIVKRCSLSLTSDGIEGNRKYFFSNKMLKLPIEKVDNISIESRFLDKLLGGNTLEIRSASSVIRFICVQNAEEFLNKTLEAIKAFQIPEKINKQNTGNNTDDELSKIVKLKEMLDSGIITQEEFDEKKKQLLNL